MKKFPVYLFMTSAWCMVMYTLLAGSAYKADFKIGTIDSPKILAEHADAIEAQSKIEAEQEQRRQQYQLKQEDLQKRSKQFENQSLMLSDAKKAEFQKELQDKQLEIMNFEQQHFAPGGSLEASWQAMMKPIVDQVHEVIDKIGTEQGYDIIFDNKDLTILYAKDEYDITEDIITALKSN